MYSQNQEEKAILDYFNTPGQVKIMGTFIDVGANDGVTFSNTRALALVGWKGVFVEPSPRAFERLKTLYNGHKGFYLYEYAIDSHNGKKILWESGPLCSAADDGLVSTFHQHEKERFQKTVKYEPVEVKTFRWKTFLNRLKVKKFDFVSLDTEGCDLAILEQMDLTDVKCIALEWNSKPELKADFEKYLDGFHVIYTSAENILYAR